MLCRRRDGSGRQLHVELESAFNPLGLPWSWDHGLGTTPCFYYFSIYEYEVVIHGFLVRKRRPMYHFAIKAICRQILPVSVEYNWAQEFPRRFDIVAPRSSLIFFLEMREKPGHGLFLRFFLNYRNISLLLPTIVLSIRRGRTRAKGNRQKERGNKLKNESIASRFSPSAHDYLDSSF